MVALAALNGTVARLSERSTSDHDRPKARWSLGDDDPAVAHGAALGAGGLKGWWAWKHRRQIRRGVDRVSPATWRGTVNVALWFGGLLAITVVGPMVVAWPRAVWFAVALVVMVAVGWWWDRSADRVSARASDP
jgi:hypothetical protein